MPKVHRRSVALGFSLLLIALSACAAPAEPQSIALVIEAAPAQEIVITLGQAEQASAPALYMDSQGVTAAWMSADDYDTYHTVRRFTWDDNRLTDAQRLSILTQFPQAHRFHAGMDDLAHLLWLDADPDAPLDGLRLWSVTVDESPNATRGAFINEDRPVYHLATHPNGDGSLWAFYSVLPRDEPTLIVRYFDRIGRPREASVLVYHADWTSAVRLPDGGIRLFWHRDDWLYSADFDTTSETLIADTERPLTTLPDLEPGDLIENAQVTRDDSHFYAFWNLSRADGQVETWLSVAALDGGVWSDPRQLFYDEFPALWGSPVQGDSARMQVFTQIGAELGLLTLEGEVVADYVSVVPLPAPGLLGLPSAQTLGGKTALAWAQPSTTSGFANMNLLVIGK